MNYRIIKTIYARTENRKERLARLYDSVKHDFVFRIPTKKDGRTARSSHKQRL